MNFKNETVTCSAPAIAELINHALSEEHGDLALVHVDLKTKWYEVCGSGSDAASAPLVGIGLQPVPSVHGDIVFPDRKHWDVVCASTSKYTLTVVLRKPHAPERA